MNLKSVKVLAMSAVLMIGSAGYGQSLGDIARQNREAKEKNTDADSTNQPKVITNKDLATDATTSAAPSGPSPAANAPHTPATSDQTSQSQRAAEARAQQHNEQQRIAQVRAAEQWKRQILAQKHKLVTLQARADQLRASIQAENGTTQYEGPNGRAQARQLQRVAEIQLQVDEQRRTLVEMQEAARHAGMHTVVYDP